MVELGGDPVPASDAHYSYDSAGNIITIVSTVQGGTSETQCFGYDYVRRLTDAWTPTDDCAAVPGVVALGGPAPYWNTYGYDATGNRLSEVEHDVAGGANDTTRTYTYPASGQPRAHAPTSVTTTAGGVTATSVYGYDAAGSTTGRPQGGNQQTLDWDAEGNLVSVTEAGATTSFGYDADGNRLIRRDASGSTVYLPSGVEVHVDTGGVKSSTRYYEFAGETVAMRTAAGIFFLGADQNNTANQTIAAADGTVVTRRFDPFGNPRGAAPVSWPGERGFVGGVTDPTGLTHLGAREYDPVAGRFISVDPLLDPTDPQQANGYGYANNSPVTDSDPTGLLCTNGPDGMCHKNDGTNVPTGGVSGPGGSASGDSPSSNSGGGGGGQSRGGGSGGGGSSSGPSDEDRAEAAGRLIQRLHRSAGQLRRRSW